MKWLTDCGRIGGTVVVSSIKNDLELRFLKSTNCPTVACYVLLSIERAMELAGIRSLLNSQGEAEAFVAKVLSKLRLMRNFRRSSKGPVFVSFMGFSESRTFPFSYSNEIVPYCFDCWPSSYERWSSFFRRHRVRLAFFSARQSAIYFAEQVPLMKSIWLPEAADPDEYDPSRQWSERDIDILELGRRDEKFHSAIAGNMALRGRRHLFEHIKGEVVFPSRADFIDGLGRTKISVCFPCSQTHPERSGAVETVTHRYFESMASKCLILGRAPRELIDLFGYNPVIEIEAGNESGQIDYILSNPSSFQGIIDRNYVQLLDRGTWVSRVASLMDAVNSLLTKSPSSTLSSGRSETQPREVASS